MSRRVALVLYEDQMSAAQLSAERKEYPLHLVVREIARDKLGQEAPEAWKVDKRVEWRACKGVDKLLAELRGSTRFKEPGRILALVDADRAAEHVGLPGGASLVAVAQKIKDQSAEPVRVDAYFLDPNLEGLLEAARVCGLVFSVEAAIERKEPLARDAALNRLSRQAHHAARACVTNAQPGLDALGSELARLLREPA